MSATSPSALCTFLPGSSSLKTTPSDSLDDRVRENAFFLIIMEDVSNFYSQGSSMNDTQARNLMRCLANFHACSWSQIQHLDRGGFWTLVRRRPLQGEDKISDFGWIVRAISG